MKPNPTTGSCGAMAGAEHAIVDALGGDETSAPEHSLFQHFLYPGWPTSVG
jgi:hypothetical protein